jgi:multidrug efflux system outer membrane protein
VNLHPHHAVRRFLILTILSAGFSAAETIDLATALRLGGANNLDIEFARNSLRQAEAKHAETRNKFFPWFTAGAGYRRLDGNTQDTPGNITDVSKQSYQAGLGIVGEVRLGEAIYQNLSAKQRAAAARHAVESTRRNLAAEISAAYFDLLKAQATMRVSTQSKQLADDYESQVTAAVAAGVAFEADQYRAQVQALRHDLAIRKALEDVQVASARLCEMLRLPNGLDLRGVDDELVPVDFVAPDASLSAQVGRALDRRPELRSREALLEAARIDTEGTVKGPLIPDLSLRANTGGLGGGPNGSTGNFDDSSEFIVGLGWRFGPGGIFDKARTESAQAVEEQEAILLEKTRQRITREVLEAMARVRSIDTRLATTRKLLEASEKAYQLSRERNATGVGGVLETLRAEEDLSFARLAWFELTAEYNKAQAALRRACGG